MGVGETGQIIGETGVGETGVGEMGVIRLYYPYGENKGADQLRGKLICLFVFAYAKSRFSHDAAHIKYMHFAWRGSLVNNVYIPSC